MRMCRSTSARLGSDVLLHFHLRLYINEIVL